MLFPPVDHFCTQGLLTLGADVHERSTIGECNMPTTSLDAAGKSATVAAAEVLRDLTRKTTKGRDARLEAVIEKGLAGDPWAFCGLIDQLRAVHLNASGKIKSAAMDAIRKLEPSCLDTDAQIQAVGIANVTSVGNENVYLEKNGVSFYFKPACNERFREGLHDFSREVVFG
ncbi:hypothetical protein Bcep1808_7026 (plasmid) [Burkholderia vietnamiensis G4]|uniref:Uncharacterized protein n=1 Tax=Burkholderia vietnamiensis (strain G4 / LMG 22486) TaxID=269482 RepID=A4JUF9_BURVG|nr:hypothetical protein Bcep1808_7026 [Burkholderia vietnamiensis G4]